MATVYFNGKFMPEHEAHVSVADRGFTLGDGLFETIRAYNGFPMHLSRHIDRLFSGLKVLKIEPKETPEMIADAVNKLVEINGLSSAYLRITISRGCSGIGFNIPKEVAPTVVIMARDFQPYSEELYEKGGFLVVSDIHANTTSPLGKVKSLNYLEKLLARESAIESGAVEALFLAYDGRVIEGCVSNIFAVFKNELVTPPISDNVLPGITREAVMKIAEHNNIKVRERSMMLEELFRADEVFITNTLMEIMPIVRIEDHAIGEGVPGSVSALIHWTYTRYAEQRRDII